MIRGLVVLLCAACASTPVPVAAPAGAPAAPLTPERILATVETTYAKASSYVDHGEQSTLFDGRDAQHRVIKTAFTRTGEFRFEYSSRLPGDDYVIWTDGKQIATAWSVRPGLQPPTLEEALGAAMGVSGGTSGMIPNLLMPELGFRRVTMIIDPVRDPDDTIAGHPCIRITGNARGGKKTLWIDKQSYLIRQVREQYKLTPADRPTFAVDTTTTFDPTVNVPVTAALLQAPDVERVPVEQSETPPWIGVMFDSHAGSSRVQNVVGGGPAARAGMQAGDVVKTIGTTATTKPAEVIAAVRAQKVGTKLHVVVTRGDHDVPLDITLEARPALDQLQHAFVGKPAPDFAIAPLSGTPIRALADLRGHVAIVDFWATWCGPCAMAMPHLVELGHKYKDLRVVGISDEDPSDITKYVADHGIDYTIARDAGDVITGHYLVTGLPTLVIIDKAGVVRALHVGTGDFDVIEAEVQQLSK